MDSTSVKQAVMKQVLQEANLANARVLIDVSGTLEMYVNDKSNTDVQCLQQKLQENCFEKCVPKPGTSLSSGETTCMTQCMEKYMAAWNQVNTAYINRIKQESGNQSLL